MKNSIDRLVFQDYDVIKGTGYFTGNIIGFT